MPSTFCVIGRNSIFYCCQTPNDHLGCCMEFNIVAQLVELFCSHSSPPKWCSHWHGILPCFLCRPSFWPEHLDIKGSKLSRLEWIRGNFVQSFTSDVASASCYFNVSLYDFAATGLHKSSCSDSFHFREKAAIGITQWSVLPYFAFTIMSTSRQIFFHS